jgi:hypothetical protein
VNLQNARCNNKDNFKKSVLKLTRFIKSTVYRHIKNTFMVRSFMALANVSISTVSKTKAKEMDE